MDSFRIHLQSHQIQRLAAPTRVSAESGLLWVTVDGDPEDILLTAGESRRFKPGARVVVYALGGEAGFVVTPGPGPVARLQAWAEKLTGWLRGFHLLPLGGRA